MNIRDDSKTTKWYEQQLQILNYGPGTKEAVSDHRYCPNQSIIELWAVDIVRLSGWGGKSIFQSHQ